MPCITIAAYLECAGSMRSLFGFASGKLPKWTPWSLGAMGVARWTGVPLAHILERAGICSTAVDVNMRGLDDDGTGQGVCRPIPVEKAMAKDTILAYGMNDALLPIDHGFPLRAIVPGWIGAASIKWLGEIEVLSEPVWVPRNTEMYILEGKAWSPDKYAPAKGKPLDEQNIKSSLALPLPASLPRGEHKIWGVARSPHAPIARVEWCCDGEDEWSTAELYPTTGGSNWTRFSFDWNATPGTDNLMTRATDEALNQQPHHATSNAQGYLFNSVYKHPVVVRDGNTAE